MARYFYDCEFLEDGQTIELISIGIVAEDGREYYAVTRDAPWQAVQRHPWLMANVVPHLPQPQPHTPRQHVIDVDNPAVKRRVAIREEVREFLLAGAGEPELWAYYGAYDHVALCQLWGTMMQLPDGMPMFTHELMQLWEQAGRPEKPEQVGEHDALGDARWNRGLYRAIQSGGEQ